LAVAVVAAGLGTTPARAADDPQAQRDQVRRQKAAAAQDVDALQASAADVMHALADLQDNLTGDQADLDTARQAEADANAAVAAAQQREFAVQDRIASIKAALRVVAVRAYISGRTPVEINFTVTDDVGLARQGYLFSQATRDVDLVNELHAAQNDLAAATRDAEARAAELAAARTDAEQRVALVTAAQQQQQTFVADVEQRLNQRLGEIQNLSTLDKQLSDQIAAQEAALAAQIPKTVSVARAGPPPPSNIPLTTVRGITVASSIANALAQMLAAASADGFDFGGYGYRSSVDQWRLRQQNCPDPANSPPWECNPPTAYPGTSMHELGLAIDFTYDGQFIDSHDNPGFQWLAANAGRYGFKNLPVEPWHWSTNGE
jgi:peptidoglycan hydrolase CwlO-like protein